MRPKKLNSNGGSNSEAVEEEIEFMKFSIEVKYE